jgi:peroxiredoxin
MDAVLIGARVALAVVFAVAAVTKLADMAGSRRALEGFGVPGRFVRPISVALPLLELTAAALLAVAPTAQAGAALAVILLAAFIAAILAALRRGAAPDCHCFGQLHSRPAGWETVARNGALGAVAVFALAAGPGPGIPSWVSHSDGTTVALVCVGLVMIVLVHAGVSLWQQNRSLTGRGRAPASPVTLEVGQSVPDVGVLSEDGTKVTVTELLVNDQRAILVFTNASCEPCVELLPELARWREVLGARLPIHVLASADPEENGRLAGEHGIPLLLDEDGAAAAAFGVEATPGAIEVDAAGRVAASTALGAPAIEGLIRAALERPAEAPSLEVRYVEGNLGARPAGAAT